MGDARPNLHQELTKATDFGWRVAPERPMPGITAAIHGQIRLSDGSIAIINGGITVYSPQPSAEASGRNDRTVEG